MMNPERSEKNSSPPLPPQPPSAPSFSLLPDEITVNYLARIPRPYYPRLSILSKSFRSLISSTQLYAARSHLGTTEECLYVCLGDPSNQFPQWFTLWVRPDDMRSTKKEVTTEQSLVPIPSSNLTFSSRSIVSVGSEVYVIGAPASAVRILDCRSHTWRNGPSMKVSRKDPAACVHDGRIYVLGGCKKGEESWGEVFDTRTQTWGCLPDPGTKITKQTISKIAEIEGKIIFRTEESDKYGYDPKQCKWESCENIIAMSELVVGNVTYVFCNTIGKYELWWSDVKNLHWRDVRGLESLGEKYVCSGGSRKHQMVSCGGKLYVIWEAVKCDEKKIWCAEIVLKKQNAIYGGEVWGQVKWVDVVHTVPISCELFECLAVTV